MKCIFAPIFLMLTWLEYNSSTLCGSNNITGQMWFMWLMMAFMCSECYVELIVRKIKGY